MVFEELVLKGVYLITPEKKEDDRGFFARVFCSEEFAKRNLKTNLIQCNVSYNKQKGTLRGMHYQVAPHAEVKIVRCTAGAICDTIIDMRPESETFRKWASVTLSAENRCLLYVPEGFAHGYQTLMDESEVFYQATAAYSAEAERGIRWNDPAVGIRWPLPVSVISLKDRNHSLFSIQSSE